MERETEYHGSRDHPDHGMVLLCSLYGGAFWDLFDNPRLTTPFNAVLGTGCMVYAYTSSSMPPSGAKLLPNPRRLPAHHPRLRDQHGRHHPARRLHRGERGDLVPPQLPRTARATRRGDVLRTRAACRCAGRRVLFFHARTWHAGGANRSDQWRNALTINMCRPWMKQRIDIPRAMDHLDLTRCQRQHVRSSASTHRFPRTTMSTTSPPAAEFEQPAE